MAQQKNQHYVQKYHLEKFSNDGLITLFIKKNKEFIKEIPYGNQCQEDYYYGKDLVMENILSKIVEGQSNNIIDDIINNGKNTNITSDEQNQLIFYIMSALMRTPSYLNNFSSKFGLEKKDLTPEDLLFILFKHWRIIDFFGVKLITNPENNFITSDSPVIFISNKNVLTDKITDSLLDIGNIYILPISPKYAVICYDLFYSEIIDKIILDYLNPDIINQLNYYKCDKIYYSDIMDEYILKLDDNSYPLVPPTINIDAKKMENEITRRNNLYEKNNIVCNKFKENNLDISLDISNPNSEQINSIVNFVKKIVKL